MAPTGGTLSLSCRLALKRFVLELQFSISVKTDVSDEVKTIDCAYISSCYEIKLAASGNITSYIVII